VFENSVMRMSCYKNNYVEGYKIFGLSSGVWWGRSEDSGVVTIATEPLHRLAVHLDGTSVKCGAWRCDAVSTAAAAVSRT